MRSAEAELFLLVINYIFKLVCNTNKIPISLIALESRLRIALLIGLRRCRVFRFKVCYDFL